MTDWLLGLTVVLTPGEGLCCVVVVYGLLCFEHCQLEGMPLCLPCDGLVISCVLCCGDEQLSMLDGLPVGMAVIVIGKVCVWLCHGGHQVMLEEWCELVCGLGWCTV